MHSGAPYPVMSDSQATVYNDDFYNFHGSYDKTMFLQFIGVIVSDLHVSRVMLDKRKWVFTVMQNENQLMNVEFISSCADDELRLHKLKKARGSIIYANNATVFNNTVEIVHNSELLLFAMHPTKTQLQRFLKDW